MASRRRRAASDDIELAHLPPTAPVGTGPAFTAPLSATDERRERELEEILTEVGSDARIKVWQNIEGKTSYAGDLSAEGFTLDVLLDVFGGGDKTLVIMQGKTRVDKVNVSLDPSVPPKNPRTKALAPTTVPGGANMDAFNMMGMMMKSSLDGAQMMNTMMAGVMGALTQVMTAAKPTTDPMEMAMKMAELMKPQQAPGGSVTEAMTMFREGMELAERYAGKGDGDDMMSVVGKGMDTLASLVDGIVTQKKAEAARLALTPVAVIERGEVDASHRMGDTAPADQSPVVSTNKEEPAVNIRPWVAAVHPFAGLLRQSAGTTPPERAALMLNEHLDDEQFDDLIEDIGDQSGGGFGARLPQYFPAFRDVTEVEANWVTKVIEVLLTYDTEDEADASDSSQVPQS